MANIANRLTTRIAYDGAALRYGSMDVRELAPALLAVGDLFQQANHLLNGDKATLAVKVKADITRGSFELNLELVQGFALSCLFAGADAVKTAKEIAEYVGFVTGAEHLSLFGLLKRLRGRKPRSVTTLENGNIEITIDGDDNTVIVSPIVYTMASDPRIRKAANDVVRPLHAPGVDVFEIREGGDFVESVTREDLQAFNPPSSGRRRPSRARLPERPRARHRGSRRRLRAVAVYSGSRRGRSPELRTVDVSSGSRRGRSPESVPSERWSAAATAMRSARGEPRSRRR